ncbi:hypothetical protein MTBBW1_540012 [Desulfamplus magnetovallimortis]|uniref:Uncharacterized protein n=1 Tax=Desulfamplus magnetovallimortis TaxID=1246637 RepID=A0A1W1HHX9_9BACT|nr:hypothetical protein MTBBW1_540012 [Desulfamplus magnetovallimortis]
MFISVIRKAVCLIYYKKPIRRGNHRGFVPTLCKIIIEDNKLALHFNNILVKFKVWSHISVELCGDFQPYSSLKTVFL